MSTDEFDALLTKAEEAETEAAAALILKEGGVDPGEAVEIAAQLFDRNLDVL